MKKSQPSKRKLVIVEARKLELDFCFDASEDGQNIKKMRMLDTNTKAETLTHIISTNDALDKTNSTINRRDSQADPLLSDSLAHRVEKEANVKGTDEGDVAHGDTEIDIEGVDVEEDKQTEATSKTNTNDLAQSAATTEAASGDQEENGKVEESTTPDLSTTESTSTKEKATLLPNPTQAANTRKRAVKDSKKSAVDLAKKLCE